MTDDICIDYKGAKIRYCETRNKWEVKIGEHYESDRLSLALAKKAVDDTFKRDAEFDRHPALYNHYNGIQVCEVLSYAEEDANTVSHRGEKPSREVWVKVDGSRRKIPASDLREDTAENRALVYQMGELKESERRLSIARNALHGKLVPYRLRQRGDKCIVITPKKS